MEQSGNRMPKAPKGEAWEGSAVDGANDPNQGNFGSTFSEASGKQSYSKAGREDGAAKSVPQGGSGRTFSSESSTGDFEQGEMPSTEINYFGFKE